MPTHIPGRTSKSRSRSTGFSPRYAKETLRKANAPLTRSTRCGFGCSGTSGTSSSRAKARSAPASDDWRSPIFLLIVSSGA